MNDKSMEKLSPTEEIAISETQPTAHAESLLNQSDPEFLQKFGEMTFDQRLEAFRSLESRYAEVEGRNPRNVITFEGTENDDEFRVSKDRIEINKSRLEKMGNLDTEKLANVKKSIFSDIQMNKEGISFGRLAECDEKCARNDVKSGICRWG